MLQCSSPSTRRVVVGAAGTRGRELGCVAEGRLGARIGARREQRADGRGRTRRHGVVQGCGAVLVERADVSALAERGTQRPHVPGGTRPQQGTAGRVGRTAGREFEDGEGHFLVGRCGAGQHDEPCSGEPRRHAAQIDVLRELLRREVHRAEDTTEQLDHGAPTGVLYASQEAFRSRAEHVLAELGRLRRPLLLVEFRQPLLVGEFVAEEVQRLVQRGRDTDHVEGSVVLIFELLELLALPVLLFLTVFVRRTGGECGCGGTEEFREVRVVEIRPLGVVLHDHIAPAGQLLPQLTRLGLRETPQQLVKIHGRSLAGGSDSHRAAGPTASDRRLRRTPTAAGPSPGRAH
ncbi:hypothetical protein [Streptomyces rapamycinicus]|uniref:hypothetical protein n=1 Tax=Streptomyces rapamycinicus TaxID=1226757 RepID=UPI0032D90419